MYEVFFFFNFLSLALVSEFSLETEISDHAKKSSSAMLTVRRVQ